MNDVLENKEDTGTGADASLRPEPAETRTAVLVMVGDSLRLLFRNYWQMALVGVVLVAARLLVGVLNFIPLLGQLLSSFISSFIFGYALLTALAVARRSESPFVFAMSAASPRRMLEMAIVLVPLGLVVVAEDAASRAAALAGLGGAHLMQSGAVLLLPTAIIGIAFVVIQAWVLLKFAFAPFFIAAVPAEAQMDPLARMRQSMRLSKDRIWRFILALLLVNIVGGLFNLIPLLGPVVIGAAFSLPLQLCVLIVIYHRLTGRELSGLTRRLKTETDRAAEDITPI
jgi:hypothetical protein